MFKFVILISVILSALGASVPEGLLPQLDGRIIGGKATSITSFPWQVSLQRNGYHSCGGAIYNERFIVTAAHCVQAAISPSILRIRAGSSYWQSGGVLVGVEYYKYHEGFNPIFMVNDIAVIRLQNSLSYTGSIRAIGLAKSDPPNGAPAVVSGWGSVSASFQRIPAQLQYVDLNIVSQDNCASNTYGYGSKIRAAMICAYASEKDACQGDSGGPLVSDNVLVGVVSWGYGCAYRLYPGVYADVSVLRNWIINNARY